MRVDKHKQSNQEKNKFMMVMKERRRDHQHLSTSILIFSFQILLSLCTICTSSGELFPVEGFPDCYVLDDSLINNTICDNFAPYNTEACEFDGGDCKTFNAIYPNCKVLNTDQVGDGKCQNYAPFNTTECMFDGLDCATFISRGFSNCHVADAALIGDGICQDFEPYNTAACQYDGGDCSGANSQPLNQNREDNSNQYIGIASGSFFGLVLILVALVCCKRMWFRSGRIVRVGAYSSSPSTGPNAMGGKSPEKDASKDELRPALDLETGEGKKSEESDGVPEQFNDDAMPTGKSGFFGSFLGRRKSKKEKTEESNEGSGGTSANVAGGNINLDIDKAESKKDDASLLDLDNIEDVAAAEAATAAAWKTSSYSNAHAESNAADGTNGDNEVWSVNSFAQSELLLDEENSKVSPDDESEVLDILKQEDEENTKVKQDEDAELLNLLKQAEESEPVDLGTSSVQDDTLPEEEDTDTKSEIVEESELEVEEDTNVKQVEESELIDLSKSLVQEEVLADGEDNEDDVNEESKVFDLGKSQLIDLGELVTEEPELLELGRSLSQQDLPPVDEEEEMNIVDSYTEDDLINLESFETPTSSLRNDDPDSDSGSDSGWSTDNSQEATA